MIPSKLFVIEIVVQAILEIFILNLKGTNISNSIGNTMAFVTVKTIQASVFPVVNHSDANVLLGMNITFGNDFKYYNKKQRFFMNNSCKLLKTFEPRSRNS